MPCILGAHHSAGPDFYKIYNELLQKHPQGSLTLYTETGPTDPVKVWQGKPYEWLLSCLKDFQYESLLYRGTDKEFKKWLKSKQKKQEISEEQAQDLSRQYYVKDITGCQLYSKMDDLPEPLS